LFSEVWGRIISKFIDVSETLSASIFVVKEQAELGKILQIVGERM
jgi:hypothetical protein